MTFNVPSRPNLDTLFSFTSGRWLCNEEKELTCRYTPFNVDALEKIACDSVSASKCTLWEKIGEGSFNKVFRLCFDNGTEVTLRIPCPVAGNVKQATASEVATMSYVYEKWAQSRPPSIPLPPKVIAWSATYDNPAETPYIILEYAPGIPLNDRWAHIEGDSAKAALASIRDLETALLHETFSQHGSLYFAGDVSEELRNRPLYPSDISKSDQLTLMLAQKYCVGPTANREWWRGDYARVEADRGPWPDMPSMIKSAAEFQLRALETMDLSSSHIKSSSSDIPLLRNLLQTCIRIAPHIMPQNSAMISPVLKHPDISLGNLIVPAAGPARVTHTIDWQHATVSPFAMLSECPPAVVYSGILIPVPTDYSMPPWPKNFAELTPEEQDIVREHHRYACRYLAYLLRTPSRDRLRGRVWDLPVAQRTALVYLVPFITRCIADGPQNLRGLLIALQEEWGSFTESPCLIGFSEDEIAAHVVEDEAHTEYTRNVTHLLYELRLHDDLMVKPEDYEHAKALLAKRRPEWDDVEMKGPFPIYEGAPSCFLS